MNIGLTIPLLCDNYSYCKNNTFRLSPFVSIQLNF